MRILTVIALLIVSQSAFAGTVVRDHRGSHQVFVKPMHLPQVGRGGFAAIAALNKGKGRGPIVRDHRH